MRLTELMQLMAFGEKTDVSGVTKTAKSLLYKNRSQQNRMRLPIRDTLEVSSVTRGT